MGWLQTYWLFSFSEYFDPKNINHGSLRVFNDDIVQPHTGFGTHPHEEMEIVSIVLHGEMTHKDTMGNKIVIKQHDVQRMTAGTGLQHSEWNEADEPVGFFQIWILPDQKGLEPSYAQKNFEPKHWRNRLALLASHQPEKEGVQLNSDALIYRAELEKSRQVSYSASKDRALFLYVVEGQLAVNGMKALSRDQVRIEREDQLQIEAQQDVDFILIDVPAKKRS